MIARFCRWLRRAVLDSRASFVSERWLTDHYQRAGREDGMLS